MFGDKMRLKNVKGASTRIASSPIIIQNPIEFKGKLQKPQGRRNPGCFNYEKHLRSEGFFAVSTISAFNIIKYQPYFVP